MDQTEGRIDWRSDRVLWLIMAVAAFWGLVYNFVILRGLGPDEFRHIAYVKLLLDDHQLPYLLPNGDEFKGAHAQHPPLYYFCQIPFFALGRALFGKGEVHVMRLFSTAICMAALPLVYQIAYVGSRCDREVARLATGLLGTMPIFGMFMGVVNNDSGLLFCTVLFLWLLTVKYRSDASLKSAAVIGFVFGLGALTKGTALLTDGFAFVIYLLIQGGWRALIDRRAWCRLLTVVGMVVLMSGWWYYRNHVIYGQWQPIPRGFSSPDLPDPSNGILVMMMFANFPAVLGHCLWGIFYSLWFQKDWVPDTYRGQVDLALLAFCLLAVVGNCVSWWRDIKGPNGKVVAETVGEERLACLTSYAAFLFTWASCLFIALFVHFGQAEGGRYLVPAFVGAALYLARGWRGLLGSKGLLPLLAVWMVAMCLLNRECVHWLLVYLNPIYGPLVQ